MTRTAAREIAVRLIFYLGANGDDCEGVVESFFEPEYFATLATEDELFASYPDDKQLEYIKTVVLGVCNCRKELEGFIEKHSNNWKIGRISKIAVAIMETAMYELLYMSDVPNAAAINEAIELAKDYEEQETVAFINGILGSFSRGRSETNGEGTLRED